MTENLIQVGSGVAEISVNDEDARQQKHLVSLVGSTNMLF